MAWPRGSALVGQRAGAGHQRPGQGRRGDDISSAVSSGQGGQGMERFVGLALVGVAQP